MNALEVKEDGTIWLIVDAPEEPKQKVSDNNDFAWRNKWGPTIEREWEEYEQRLASAERLLVGNQEVAHGAIWRNYASQKDRQHGNEIKPGIYPIPGLKWKRKKNWVSGDRDNKWFEDTAIVSLPESDSAKHAHTESIPSEIQAVINKRFQDMIGSSTPSEESQEELWREVYWKHFDAYAGGGIPYDRMLEDVMKLFTITRKA